MLTNMSHRGFGRLRTYRDVRSSRDGFMRDFVALLRLIEMG